MSGPLSDCLALLSLPLAEIRASAAMDHPGRGFGFCYQCDGGDHADCLGVPCECPCDCATPEQFFANLFYFFAYGARPGRETPSDSPNPADSGT